jgi:hypothetical protein
MATNKNQHFVPRCYLRSFTVDCANKEINLFNIDRLKFIEHAPVKNQCSGDYFYGKDLALDKALQATEAAYGKALRDILRPGYKLTDSHRDFLRRFWLLQFMRTDAASRRAVEMNAAMEDIIGIEVPDFRYGIREAVQIAMRVFADKMNLVDDLKICLFKNRTSIPFVTSDDPAVVTNRWYLRDRRTRGRAFGLRSAGNLLLLPLSPRVLCLGYDGDVYSVPHKGGWVDVRNDKDVEALNQYQFLNCWANIYVHDSAYSRKVYDVFCTLASIRPKERHIINYAVLDTHEGEFKRYRVIDPDRAVDHQEALIHIQKVYAQPNAWPKQLRWRSRGIVFTNGTGIGYVRRRWAKGQEFRKELARKTK